MREIPLSEVRNHTTTNSAWTIIDGYVYDVTDFLSEHPGGSDILMSAVGRDATVDFFAIGHTIRAKKRMLMYRIGVLSDDERIDKILKKDCNALLYAIGALALAVVVGFGIKKAMAN